MFSITRKRLFGSKVPRSSKFKEVTSQDISKFRSILGDHGVVEDPKEMQPYNIDWTSKYKGESPVVLRPGSTEEVAEVLKYCNQEMIAVVPQSGNTGLVGGQVPVHDEIILQMGRMNKIHGFDKAYGILSCEAGCILQSIDEYLKERGHQAPIDLGAKGSCFIGGNFATNAGGIHFIKNNSLHANAVGLKVALPNGQILDNLESMRKDNTGYDLKQLFIGAEGTLVSWIPHALGGDNRVLFLVPGSANFKTSGFHCPRFIR